MNKKLGKRMIALVAALVVMLAFPAAAFATNISVTADSTSVKTGDTVTVTVTVSGEHIAAADGVFTYDPALLSYIGSDGGASDGVINMVSLQKGGTSSLTAVIRFAATGAGDAEVRVTIQHALNYNEQPLGTAEAGVSVAIASAGTEPTPGESAPQIDLSLTGVPAENVTGAAEPMYIWRTLTSLTLPSGFADRQVTYHGEYVGGAAIPDTEDLLLLYLSGKTGDNAGFYIYDVQKDAFFPYLTIQSVSKNFTLIWPDDTVQVPEGYEEATLLWKEKEVPAWIAKGSDGSVYLVYARNSAGERGLFLYNVEDESVQRYIAPSGTAPEPTTAPSAQPSTKPSSGPDSPYDVIPVNAAVLYAACGGGALLAAAAVVFIVLYLKASRGQRNAARMEKRLRKASQDKDMDA